MSLYKVPRLVYNPQHCEELIKWMSKGLTNIQICAKLGISEKTFYDWRRDRPEFQEAFDLGDPLRFNFLMEQGDELFLKGVNDKGYKHWQKKMSYMYRDYSPEASLGTTNNIQIANMNVLNNKSDGELLEILNQKLEKLRMLPDPTYIEVKPDE